MADKTLETKPTVTETKGPGQPPLWKDPIELKQMIMDYFNSEEGKTKPTLSGLAWAMGIDRKTLYNYQQKDEFFPTIKKARDQIEKKYEELLMFGEKNPTGVIFALKNMGWADKTEIDHTSLGEKISGFNYLAPPTTSDDSDNNPQS